eukprot:1139626-Pelagomonas_calceolata.AAC.1
MNVWGAQRTNGNNGRMHSGITSGLDKHEWGHTQWIMNFGRAQGKHKSWAHAFWRHKWPGQA